MARAMIRGTKVNEKLAALCEAVLGSRQFKDANQKIEAFLTDEAAREQLQECLLMADRLQKRRAKGFEPTAGEAISFQKLSAAAQANPLISDFTTATAELREFKENLIAYFGLAFELSRVPTEKDLEEIA